MRKLSLTLLAASTMLIAAVATAQPRPGARPGATWRGGGAMGGHVQMRGGTMGGGNVRMHGGNVQMRGGQVRTGGGFQAHGGNFRMRGGNNFRMHHGGGTWRFHRWGPRPGHNFRHSRLRRGGFINSFWFAPQFFIGDWQSYGFYAPGADQRGVRYYDDAYLIDDHGRVIDTRYGVDWGRYGGDWDYQDGIPGYRGEWRDFDESDYAEGYDEGYEESEDYAERDDRRGHGGYGGPGGPMMPPPGYGPPPPGAGGYTHVYGGYGGYGMYAYPIVIETVTTSGGGYVEEIVEEVVETRQRRRARRPRARCACTRPAPRPVIRRPAPPRPRPGERG
jgi:Ni/Co efflux regulator RcnB